MHISRRELGCLLPAALVAWPLNAAAQSPNTVEAIANYAGGDRQAILEAGARRERGLLLYTTGTQIEPLIRGFRSKYRFLNVTVQRGTQADIARRALEEYRAGVRKLDMFELLIVDDIGYIQQSADEVEVLFTLMAERYAGAPWCGPTRWAASPPWAGPPWRRTGYGPSWTCAIRPSTALTSPRARPA